MLSSLFRIRYVTVRGLKEDRQAGVRAGNSENRKAVIGRRRNRTRVEDLKISDTEQQL